jgi:hypothetical protein
LHNEELHNVYSSPDIIRMMKSRWMWWAGHVARLWDVRYTIMIGKPEGNRLSEDLDLDRRMILGWILGK